ncbi:935_t:CDS:1, partial [Dentiscutata heterogama]
TLTSVPTESNFYLYEANGGNYYFAILRFDKAFYYDLSVFECLTRSFIFVINNSTAVAIAGRIEASDTRQSNSYLINARYAQN